MQRILKAISLGIITASLGVFSYFFLSSYELEENLGLDTLFKIRGSIPTQDNSVIITINKKSSDYYGLENDPTKWPRSYHTKLIKSLNSQGAKAIVFDIFFKKPRDEIEDKNLALAIRNSGNVILFSHLKREILSQQGQSPQFSELNQSINIERLVYPTDVIAAAPVALAPFALLKYPQKVTKFWTFRIPAGEIPNMPVMTFQLATMENYRNFHKIIQEIIPAQAKFLSVDIEKILQGQKLVELVGKLRSLFKENPTLANSIRKVINNENIFNNSKHALLSLVDMYQGPNQYYLNFYGPPRTIKTIPYHEVLNPNDKDKHDFKGKVVFVGFSEFLQPEQKDNFYTVFSQPNGLDISGVEIAATAFNNLLNRETIKTLSPFSFIALIIIYGLLISFACRYFYTIPSVFISLALVLSYALTVNFIFQEFYLWLPWVVPLLIQTPFALFVALLWQYSETRREREQIREAFGYYLPSNVVNKISQNAGHLDAQHQKLFGICLSTDAAQYTSMSEQIPPEQLSKLINKYYEKLFEPVRNHGGIISDVVGDAMLAIWSSPQSDVALRTQACTAALEINNIMNSGNKDDQHLLPTRIGLHAGELMLGNVGAIDHFEYRAVGDIVNTSNRIESLNKQIGCNVIASEDVVQGVTGITMRCLGKFRLVGKRKVLQLYELMSIENEPDCDKCHIQIRDRCEMLELGITAFQAQDWQTAISQFSALKSKYYNDKAADFYLKYCDLLSKRTLPSNWEGIIELSEK